MAQTQYKGTLGVIYIQHRDIREGCIDKVYISGCGTHTVIKDLDLVPLNNQGGIYIQHICIMDGYIDRHSIIKSGRFYRISIKYKYIHEIIENLVFCTNTKLL